MFATNRSPPLEPYINPPTVSSLFPQNSHLHFSHNTSGALATRISLHWCRVAGRTLPC